MNFFYLLQRNSAKYGSQYVSMWVPDVPVWNEFRSVLFQDVYKVNRTAVA